VHVHTEGYAVPAPVPVAGASYLELRAKMEQSAREALGRTVAALPQDARAEGVLLEGDPAAELAKATEDLDLLVTGSRRYGPLRSTLAGGVTGPLLRAAHCPVIVVPRGIEAPLGKLFAAREQAVG
jgi:nucleotide-binding universal stress UspA family protein